MVKGLVKLCSLVALVAGLTACSSGPESKTYGGKLPAARSGNGDIASAAPVWQTRPNSEIAPGFEIHIENAEDAKINGTFRVGPDGNLKLPYDVKVKAAGSTVPQLQQDVRNGYKSLLKAPAMNVTIANREYYVDVRGLVRKPGQYLVKDTSSLDELIAKADGLQESARPDGSGNQAQAEYARIEQLGVTGVIRLRDYFSGQSELIPAWQGGETIFFQSERGAGALVGEATRDYVTVLGQVRNPGEYPYVANADVFHYFLKAGGPTDRGDVNELSLIKMTPSGRQVTTFRLEQSDSIPSINAGDTLIVGSDVPGPVEKKTRVIGGVASIITGVATIILLFATL